MGLDMFLYRKTYSTLFSSSINFLYFLMADLVSADSSAEEEKTKISLTGNRTEGIDTNKIVEIVEEAGYWRKANAIHNWFVENVQDGMDDCREYYVSEEQLRNLLSLVDTVLKESKLVDGTVVTGYLIKDGKEEPVLRKGKVIENPTVAERLLPTRNGFFFGGTEYDEDYIQDLESTKRILEEALAKGGDYYYSSSW